MANANHHLAILVNPNPRIDRKTFLPDPVTHLAPIMLPARKKNEILSAAVRSLHGQHKSWIYLPIQMRLQVAVRAHVAILTPRSQPMTIRSERNGIDVTGRLDIKMGNIDITGVPRGQRLLSADWTPLTIWICQVFTAKDVC